MGTDHSRRVFPSRSDYQLTGAKQEKRKLNTHTPSPKKHPKEAISQIQNEEDSTEPRFCFSSNQWHGNQKERKGREFLKEQKRLKGLRSQSHVWALFISWNKTGVKGIFAIIKEI